MKIRSITYFFNPGPQLDRQSFGQAQKFGLAARQAYTEGGYEVQSMRMATVPFRGLLTEHSQKGARELARVIERAAREAGYEYISIGPARPEDISLYSLIPEVLANSEAVFVSGILAEKASGISLAAVKACAQVIQEASPILPDGFANLRFAALANVRPGAPFFPAAFHSGEEPAFAIATEAADLAVEAFSRAATLAEAQAELSRQIEAEARRLEAIGGELATRTGIRYLGIDFSLAPYPEQARSIGTAIERLGVPAVGMHGTLAAAALITAAIGRARFTRTGFCGLFMPLLEDWGLARSAEQGLITIQDLMLYSAVCGTGIDTLPLPGDTSAGQLTAILLDLAALALRLDKPLTARLLPVPGKTAGETTDFDFAFFANSRILPVRASPLGGVLARDGYLRLDPIRSAGQDV